MLLVPQTAAVASNVILLFVFCFCILFLYFVSSYESSRVCFTLQWMASLFLVVPSVFFFFFFFVLYFCLSHLVRGGMTATPLYHRCRQSTKEVAFPPPPSSGTFSRDVFVFLLQRFFRIVWFPLLFVFVFVPCCPCGGRVAMLAVWTQLPPKDRKEVTDRVAMLTVAFGTCRLLHRVLLWSALLLSLIHI